MNIANIETNEYSQHFVDLFNIKILQHGKFSHYADNPDTFHFKVHKSEVAN